MSSDQYISDKKCCFKPESIHWILEGNFARLTVENVFFDECFSGSCYIGGRCGLNSLFPVNYEPVIQKQ